MDTLGRSARSSIYYKFRITNGTIMECRAENERLRIGMSKSIIGQEHIFERPLICLLAYGNLLLEGLPGLLKTREIKALVNNLDADFSHIQFTPYPLRPVNPN